MHYYKEQIARWTKASNNLEWNSGVYIFIVLFLFSGLCKAEIIWSYYHLSSEDRKEKKKSLARLARDRQRRYRSWLVNLGDQVERWRERCVRLDVCRIGNWQSCYWTSKRKGSWYFFFYRNHTFKYTTCLRKCVFLACHRPVGFSFLFIIIIMLSKIFPVVASDQKLKKNCHPTLCTSVHRRALSVNGSYRSHPL